MNKFFSSQRICIGHNSARPWFLQLKNVGESCWVGATGQMPYSEGGGARTIYSTYLGPRLLSWPT